ncbi:putative RNA-directed DNA polymerase from transposon X-element, partial [Stegodyphus mimosarum]
MCRKMLCKFTKIIHAVFRLQYFPANWKTVVISLILKPGKDPTLVTSYRPISLYQF